jgi:hypothetical protein
LFSFGKFLSREREREREREFFFVVALRAVEGGGGGELESGDFIDELLTKRGGEGLCGTEEG